LISSILIIAVLGLAKENRGEKVKLHCTIMNTRLKLEAEEADQGFSRNGDNGGRNRPGNRYNLKNRESFDASLILSVSGWNDLHQLISIRFTVSKGDSMIQIYKYCNFMVAEIQGLRFRDGRNQRHKISH